jgi:hypothetical protein
MNDRGSDSPEPVQIIFFVAADASRRLRQLVCFGVKSTLITQPPDLIGDFLAVVDLVFNDEAELVEASVTAVSVPVSTPVLPVSVPDSLLLSELSSKFFSLVYAAKLEA